MIYFRYYYHKVNIIHNAYAHTFVEKPSMLNITIREMVQDCHYNDSCVFVTWKSQAEIDILQTDYYQYRLTGNTELKATILQEINTTDTFANITNISYNYINITFSITAHNCAGKSDEATYAIQGKLLLLAEEGMQAGVLTGYYNNYS